MKGLNWPEGRESGLLMGVDNVHVFPKTMEVEGLGVMGIIMTESIIVNSGEAELQGGFWQG